MEAVAPDWLTDDQAAEWHRAVAELGGVWTAERCMHLEVYVCERSHWIEAQRDIAQNGAAIPIRDDKGVIKSVSPSPYYGIADRSRKAMTAAWLAVLGTGHARPSLVQAAQVVAVLARGGSWEEAAAAAKVPLLVVRGWATDASPECVAFVDLCRLVTRPAAERGKLGNA